MNAWGEYATEKEFQAAVVDYARANGWCVFSTWSSQHSPAGEPDLRMVKPPRYLLAELKVQNRKLISKQQETIDLLKQCPGVEVYVWHPRDWAQIESILGKK